METVIFFNFIISVLFTICYSYQFVYMLVGLFKKPKMLKSKHRHRYAVVIAARNEGNVIGNLIQSIRNQTYPSKLIDVFVVADNCTDDTSEVAKSAGAYVYERFNKKKVGKGYALDWLFNIINTEHSDKKYDAYIVFDADNVIATNFIEEMNKVFDNGYGIITSYRNSKNYDHNWITAGYSLWFLRESKFLNNARMQIGTSCAISGTGFLVSTDIINKNGGWIHHLLTEDIEFTTDSIILGEKIGYSGNAVLYDEQPTTLHQSYLQRLRWAKGFYQVFANYGKRLIGGVFKGSFSCYDMLMTIMPAMLLTLISISMNIIAIPFGITTQSVYLSELFISLGKTFLNLYLMFWAIGIITTITEWDQILCSKWKKIAYTFTFPLFMFTYVPISVIALFKNVKWEPIKHSVSKTLDEMVNEDMVPEKETENIDERCLG